MTEPGNMDHGGEAPRPTTVESTDLGMAGAVQGGQAHMSTGAQLGLAAAAARRAGGFDEFARRLVHLHAGQVPVAAFIVGASWLQLGPADVVLPDGVIVDVVPLHDNYGYSALQPRSGAVYNVVYALQPRPGAEHGEVLVDLLPGGAGHGEVFVGLLPGAYDNYGAGRGEVFIGPLFDGVGVGAAFDNSAILAQQTLPGTDLGAEHDGGSGTLAEHLHRLIPFVGIGASSVAVNGLADGPASAAAAFHLFVLLLGGLFLVILHVLRV